jgi:DNA-directed RNA polymerase delta subunit
MASYLQILESAYSLAKNKYKSNSFTIDSLISEMQNNDILDKSEHNAFGLFYNEILKDTRFIYCGNKK